MKIRTRIMSLVFILIVSMVAAVTFALTEFAKIGDEINEITSGDIPLTETLTQVTIQTFEQAINFERALRFASQAKPGDRSYVIPLKEAKGEFERLSALGRMALEDGEKIMQEIQSGSPRAAYGNAYKLLLEIKNAYSQYEHHAQEILSLLESGNRRESELEFLIITGEEEQLRKALKALAAEIQDVRDTSALRVNHAQQTAIKGVVAISALTLVVGLILAILITRSITAPLGAAVHLANEIAQGNKDVAVTTSSDGEVGQLLSAMKEMLQAVNRSESTLKAHAEELARSNADLEQFAYFASHDLREPLRMIACYTQLLASEYKGKLGTEADEYIRFAVEGANRMENLIEDLLSYSRLGKRAKEFSSVDCNMVLKKVIANLKKAIDESKAEIKLNKLPTVRGDEVQLVQLFQNLIGNAIKFRGKKKPAIEVAAQKEDGLWRFAVRDNGIGIEPQFFERIFIIFQRLHNISEYPGTGVGLAICKKVVEQHGGTIWVESKPDEGATFYFTLPA